MNELLPRGLFSEDASLFRMNEKNVRTPDANCCVHSSRALEIIAENAVALSSVLRPTTGRYFFWGDDSRPWCRCPKCHGLSDSEQALVLENHLLKALRRGTLRVEELPDIDADHDLCVRRYRREAADLGRRAARFAGLLAATAQRPQHQRRGEADAEHP